MINKIIDIYKNFEKSTHKIINNGLKFCFILCITSVLILLTYNLNIVSPFYYHIGISLFKLSLNFAIEFIICGFVIEGIKKQLV